MTIVIIGAGYVDLHLAIAFAKHFRVIMIVILKIKKIIIDVKNNFLIKELNRNKYIYFQL